ncbi:MAG: PAS domain-containing protein [Thermodesulfovibrionales bacterium]|nr:PAS domain-containing protein [Thermodesulfovibrionales bacterium]
MFKNRLAYKLLVVFLVFALAVIAPLSLILYYDSVSMIQDIERVAFLLPEQKAIHDGFETQVIDTFVSLVFYIFILSFIASLFLSRRFLMPVRELYRGAKAIEEGVLDMRLDVKSDDELGAVTKAFNDMAAGLKEKTNALMRKDIYVNSMLDPLWVVDMDNIITDINPAFTRLLGYTIDEVIGASIFDFLDEENEKVMRTQLSKRDEGISSSYGISIISKNEGLIPVLISGAPVVENGEVVAKIGIIKDFRAEVALRDALKEEKDHSEAIMDSLVDVLVVINRDMRIIKANRAAIATAGEDITGRFCHEIFHKLPESCFIRGMDCPVKVVFETGRSYKTVHEHVEAGNVKVFHEITAFPVKSSGSEIINVVELIRDITEKKSFEDEIAQRNKELVTLNSISRMLSHSLRAEDIFNNVLEKVIDMLRMDGGGIYFLDEAGRELICRYQKGASEDFMRGVARVRVGEDIPGRVAVTGQSIVSPDILKDERVEKSILRHSGIRGLAAIPVKGKEKLMGVFYIFSFSPRIFTPEDERILDSVGEMAGMAFENIRLYEKMRELYEHQRKRRAAEQQNLLMFASLLSDTLDINTVLDSAVSAIKDTSKADFVWLLQADETGNLLLSSASQEAGAKGGMVYSRDTSSIERYSMEKRKPIVFSELVTESRFYLSEYLSGYNTACSIPVYVGNKTLGAFTLYFRGFTILPEEDIFFLQTAGNILAVSMERARLYEEVIIEKGMADAILQSIADGIMTVDTDGRVVSMNRAAKAMTGLPYALDEPVGRPCCDIFGYSPENTELRWALGECLEEAVLKRVSAREAELFTAGGRKLPIEINSAPVTDKEGKVAGVVYVLRDKSREKEMDTMKTEFVRAVSHEFRTPLSAIVGMAEMLMDGEVGRDRQREYLNTILLEGRRLSDMVSELLDVARIESGKEVFRESEIDFKAVLEDIREAFNPVILKKEMKFSTRLEEEIKGYKGDKDKIKQMLMNLVDNSLTYSDGGCAVEVNVGRHGDAVRIQVRDEGWGIPDEDMGHLGEKFYRGRHGLSTKGTGLGLSLCREIAKMHGGDLHIESAAGEGTTVTVEIPLRRKE